jgi:CheY-like chemotaxis protein
MERKKIMIIDDDSEDRFFFKEALDMMVYSVECIEAKGCVDSFEVLNREEELPHFIFLDINMPKIDGRECLQQLKSHEKFKHIPVIVYSTYFSEKFRNELINLGASSCIEKAMDLKTLPEQLFEIINIPK